MYGGAVTGDLRKKRRSSWVTRLDRFVDEENISGMIDYVEIIRKRLRTSLVKARKARDDISIAEYRSLIALLDNASAIPVDLSGPSLQVQGSADVPRRLLRREEVLELLRQEHHERIKAATEYRKLGRDSEAARLEAQADVLERVLEECKQETQCE